MDFSTQVVGPETVKSLVVSAIDERNRFVEQANREIQRQDARFSGKIEAFLMMVSEEDAEKIKKDLGLVVEGQEEEAIAEG